MQCSDAAADPKWLAPAVVESAKIEPYSDGSLLLVVIRFFFS